MSDVLVQQDGPVAVVTLNRPQRRNAISSGLLAALRGVLAELDANPAAGAIVLTGADPAFCAGLDLGELAESGNALASSAHLGRPWPELSTPLIGAINGPAVTGGLELALTCDFLVASDRASFADTHARVGIQPGWGMTVLLPEAVGLRRAREMSGTGNFIGAQTALQWGLVNHVVRHAELLGFACGLAADIASNDRAAVTALYSTYRQGALVTGTEAAELELRAHAAWHGGRIDPGQVAGRRAEVISRGRSRA
ncbi:MAG TPA: enoyl-CoA hydratase [Streptosporangiaceae bacterium]